MMYKDNWEDTKLKWTNYWRQKNSGRPLMCVVARRPEIERLAVNIPAEGEFLDVTCQGINYNLPDELYWKSMEDKYMNAEQIIARYRHFCRNHLFLAESFPNLNVDFGPGSLAAYLGSEITFKEDTVWFEKCIDDWSGVKPFSFDPENKWFQKHAELVGTCRKLAGDDFYVDMPDLMENLDVLASLRGAGDLIYDMIDEPELIKERIEQITGLYFEYFDLFYDIIKDSEGGSAYTVFQIWGPGKTIKLQCDFSALLSPSQFTEFVLDSLRQQAKKADCVLYHLDGPDAIKHLDALMQIDEIDALQWTSGDNGPDGTLEKWFPIYDKAHKAGKSLWIKVYTGDLGDWIRNVDTIVRRYGSRGLFLHFPEMSLEQANTLIDYAERHWSDIEGSV